jgi:uncharacterized protein (TIGR03435 family)
MIRTITAFVCFSTAALLAQTSQPALTFDVTSVKPNRSGAVGGTSKGEPGRYVGINVTLRRVMGLAFFPVQEIVGGPAWINADRFDIEGKADAAPNQEQMRGMLRALLVDRFKLVVHRETRQMPGYALTLSRADGRLGTELRRGDPCASPSTPQPSPQRECGGFTVGSGALKGSGVTIRQLAAELPSATEGRQVVDRTGLEGTFDVSLTWNAEALRPAAPAREQAASIFASIQEQLGLKLEPATLPIEVIVIESVERPEEN